QPFSFLLRGGGIAMSFGKFQGEVIAKWSRDPPLEARNMSLMADFSYIEPTRPPTVWPAAKGRCIDGASIPEFLWSLVGSPFTGIYRRASVVHDIACQDKPLTSDRAHYMFYLAMRCDRTPRPFGENHVPRCPNFWTPMGGRALTRSTNSRKRSTVSS